MGLVSSALSEPGTLLGALFMFLTCVCRRWITLNLPNNSRRRVAWFHVMNSETEMERGLAKVIHEDRAEPRVALVLFPEHSAACHSDKENRDAQDG